MLNWIKVHKSSIIYFVSFFLYPFPAFQVLLPRPSFVCVVATVLIFLFQLTYIIWLRRKENVSLGRSIARFFLYLLAVPNAVLVWYFVDTFINGYTYVTLFGYTGATYYGFEAWARDEWMKLLFSITFTAFAVYLALYLAISAVIRRSNANK